MTTPMRCPACGFDNIAGNDSCEHCGASLLEAEASPVATFLDRLVVEHLDAIGAGPPATIGAAEPVATALERMRAEGIDCLLVMNGDHLVGIFTDRDAVLKVAGHEIGAFDVRDVMTRDPVVLRSDDTLAVAVHKMAIGGYRHIPIVGDDGPAGIVAARDVFRHVLALAS